MRRYGKYEKRPDKARVPEAKSALLQTYFTSLVCLVLCVSMFFGTSFAWFTSEVNNTGNEIYIGTLDVELKKLGSDGKYVSMSAVNAESGTNVNKLYTDAVRWEPGYTALETVQIVNEGDLAFKYVLSFTDGALTEGNKLPIETVAGFFEVWVHEGTPTPASYADITEANDWIPAGTLAEILAGKSVLEGVMEETDVRIQKETQPAAGEAAEAADEESSTEAATEAPTEPASGIKPTTHTYTIALHMNEAADASVMGHKISLNVKLVAYQLTSEKDAFTDGNYDKNVAYVDRAETLKTALEAGGEVVLTGDVDLNGTRIEIPAGVTANLSLNGHKIADSADKPDSLITNKGTLTIQGNGEIAVVFNGPVDNSAAVNVIANRGVLTVNGGTISNTGTGDQIGYGIDNYTGANLTVNGGKIDATGSSAYDGIRLFCGSEETLVTVNAGEISSIWAQNPSANKATEVKGTVVINGGNPGTVHYENYTTVKVKTGVTVTVTAYGDGKDNTIAESENGYTVYSFVHQ